MTPYLLHNDVVTFLFYFFYQLRSHCFLMYVQINNNLYYFNATHIICSFFSVVGRMLAVRAVRHAVLGSTVLIFVLV